MSNVIHAHDPHDEKLGNSNMLASRISISTSVHSTQYGSMIVNNNNYDREISPRLQKTTRDDKELQKYQWVQRMNHQELLSDMFGTNNPVLYPTVNMTAEREPTTHDDNEHGHINTEQLAHENNETLAPTSNDTLSTAHDTTKQTPDQSSPSHKQA